MKDKFNRLKVPKTPTNKFFWCPLWKRRWRTDKLADKAGQYGRCWVNRVITRVEKNSSN